MRRWHRWLSLVFGALILWVAATGLLAHGAALWPAGTSPAAAAPPGFVCPDTMTCLAKPPPDSPRAWKDFFHRLHTGGLFGRTGTILSIASGLALLFFAFSGLWMYLYMFRARARSRRGGHPLFWK